MDKPSPAPTSLPTLSKAYLAPNHYGGVKILNEIVVDRDSSFPPFVTLLLLHLPFPPRVGEMVQCEKPCVSLVSLEYVMRCDNPQHCLQMQINFPHTSASNKLRRQIVCSQRPNILFINLKRGRGGGGCFVSCQKKYLLFVRERSIAGNSAHQFEVRGRGEMPQSSVQINLRSAGPRQPLTHRVNGNVKGSLLNTSISSLNKLSLLEQKTEEKAVCKLIKPCSSSNPSQISYLCQFCILPFVYKSFLCLRSNCC